MAREKEFDIRELPSWKYFSWGLINGLFLGISIKDKINISETGIMSLILDAFKPIFEMANLSTNWINTAIIFLAIIGFLSLGLEIFSIWNKGWAPRIIALCGFLSLFLLILNINFGIWVFIAGGILVMLYPNK